MENADSLNLFFARVKDGLDADAKSKSQNIPLDSIHYEADEIKGTMWAAHYMKYLIYGRGPGKAPPPDKLLDWVSSQPEAQMWKEWEKKSLAYVIGQKIAKMGTDIYQGKRPGIDLLGVMEKNMPDLLKSLARNEVIKIATDLRQAIK